VHYRDTPAKVRAPAMLWFVGFISSLNFVLGAVLLWRGFDFWPGNPGGVDLTTASVCLATILVTALWAVAALNEHYGRDLGRSWR
jgi:hypothetical protein